MRLPGAVGIDSRDRRGVRRGTSEILTSLMPPISAWTNGARAGRDPQGLLRIEHLLQP
jgi:hypothetical protein